nr:hypothetical protein HmN_000642700 [Hymenolepis microstoma]
MSVREVRCCEFDANRFTPSSSYKSGMLQEASSPPQNAPLYEFGNPNGNILEDLMVTFPFATTSYFYS